MKLKELLIQDFRGIEKLSIDFCGGEPEPQRLVVLAGPNGAGKTSVLEAILLGVGRRELLKYELAGNYRQVRSGAKDFVIQARFRTDSEDALLATVAGFPIVHDDTETGFSCDFAPDGNELMVSLPGVLLWGSAKNTDVLSDDFRKIYFSLSAMNHRITYYSAWREATLVGPLGPSTVRSANGEAPRDDEESRLKDIKQAAINAALHEKFGQGDAFTDVYLHKFNAWWNRFHDVQPGHFEVTPISGNPDEGFDFYLIRDDGAKVPLDMLSSGEMELLKFFRLMMRKQDGGIVLIDEPEQHLHPKWHRLILPMILDLAPKAQVICATHSPQIIGSTPPHQLWLTYLDDQGRIAIAQPGHSFGMDANRVLEELLDVAARPEEVRDQIRNLFDLIETRKLDEAKQQVASLRARLGDDPELVRADALIRRKEAIGR